MSFGKETPNMTALPRKSPFPRPRPRFVSVAGLPSDMLRELTKVPSADAVDAETYAISSTAA